MLCTVTYVEEPAFDGDPGYLDYTYSDPTKIHLHAGTNTLRLVADPITGLYPKDAWYSVRGPAWAPGALRAWRGIFIWSRQYDTMEGRTALAWRLYSAGHEYAWVDGAWVQDGGAGDVWNTLAELQAGFPSWPARTVSLVHRMMTTDPIMTPSIVRVLVMADLDLQSSWEEWILRVLVPKLREIRLEADVVLEWNGEDSMQLTGPSGYDWGGEPIHVVDVVGAYDAVEDPHLLQNKLVRYDAVAGKVYATGFEDGQEVFLRVLHDPDVALRTHPDYVEVSRLPAIELEEITEVQRSWSVSVEGCVNVTTGEALIVPIPEVVDLQVLLRLVASRSLDLLRLHDQIGSIIRKNHLLQSQAMGESAQLVQLGGATLSGGTDGAHVHEALQRIVLRAICKWDGQADVGFGVRQLDSTITKVQ